ncbi:MAG: tetratricopeptide repeat protein [Acidobacteria bacterium]|nr:tetratricopeptide repeat protein [Acidobacteriota bacterium]
MIASTLTTRQLSSTCASLCLRLAPVVLSLPFVLGASSLLMAQESPQKLLAQGQYTEAIAESESILARSPDQTDAMATLLEAMIRIGDYRKAASRGETFLTRKSDSGVVLKTAVALMRVGEYERAEELLAPFSSPQALWMRGTLAKRKGDRQAARSLFGQAAGMLDRAISSPLGPSPLDLAAIADSMTELARYQEANQIYQSAAKLAPDDTELKTRWAILFAVKHNPAEAEGLYREALEINPKLPEALVGLAELAAGNWEGKASTLVQQALEVNPNLAEARLLLAQVNLEQENYSDAEKELAAIDRINPRLLESWSLHVVSKYLQGDTQAMEQQWLARILKENPTYGEVFADLGDFSVIRRQYGPAVNFYRRALDKDPELDEARSNLGINVFRLGQEEEARRILEEAYARDPFNVWTVNTLRLMDSLENYDTFETDRFSVKLNPKESALLWPYVNELLDKSLTSLTTRYGYDPPTKVLFEVFPDHEDFAVRTLGLPGLGALGASFGPVVAMDSPSARPTGEFHWGSTLWHELGHVITLGMTSNKIPRWFTEGLSVYEEAHARPGWGDPLNLGLIQALQQHGLVPIEKFDGVFVRPQYPMQVVFAYFQAGMICDFIVDTYGFPKILALLRAYSDGKTDAEAIREALYLSLEEFDKVFSAYAKEKTYGFGEAIHFDRIMAGEVELPVHDGRERGPEAPRAERERIAPSDPSRNFLGRLREAADLRKQGKLTEAIVAAEAAKRLFPLYAEESNPYELLAGIYEEHGEKEKAVDELVAWRLQRGRNPSTFKKLAELQAELGRRGDAIQTLTEALQVAMFDIEIHDRLAGWALEESNTQIAVREYRAVLALNPPDRAEAHFRLASAYWKQADASNARREILAALEIAPGYRPAQQLLLELARQ